MEAGTGLAGLGSRSQQVYLLENPRNRKERVVLKRYDASDRHHRGRYDKELKVLKHLRGRPHAPQLLHSDDDTCALWMTYCGRVAPMNPRTKAAVEAILKELADKWGVHRVSNGGAVNRLDAASIFPKNITQIDGHTKPIDYGSPSYASHQLNRLACPCLTISLCIRGHPRYCDLDHHSWIFWLKILRSTTKAQRRSPSI